MFGKKGELLTKNGDCQIVERLNWGTYEQIKISAVENAETEHSWGRHMGEGTALSCCTDVWETTSRMADQGDVPQFQKLNVFHIAKPTVLPECWKLDQPLSRNSILSWLWNNEHKFHPCRTAGEIIGVWPCRQHLFHRIAKNGVCCENMWFWICWYSQNESCVCILGTKSGMLFWKYCTPLGLTLFSNHICNIQGQNLKVGKICPLRKFQNSIPVYCRWCGFVGFIGAWPSANSWMVCKWLWNP